VISYNSPHFANANSLSGKGHAPLRIGQKTNKIDSPPNGQTPFRIGSKLSKGRHGRSITPIIAALVIISGAVAGALMRSQQTAALVNQSTHSPRAAASTPGILSAATPVKSMLENRIAIPLATEDIDDTVEAPSIAVSDSGIVYVAWASKTGESERKLMMSRSEDSGRSWVAPWQVTSSPIHVAVSEMRGRRIERRLHLLPLIATHQDRLFLTWVRGGEDRTDVTMLLATSDDQGKSFSEPIRVHQSDQARPTFTSMSVSREGDVACAWLDNRKEVQQCFMAVKSSSQNTFTPEMLVDPGQNEKGICPCCPTSVAFAPDQSVWVAYRGNVDGMRDMWTARWQPGDAKPSAPMPTNQPTWKFDGCPHDGPTLIPLQGNTTIAWMDAHQGMSRVFVNQLKPSDLLTTNESPQWVHADANPIDARFEGTQEQPALTIDPSTAIVHAAWSATESPADQSIAASTQQSHAHGHSAAHGTRRAIHYATSLDGGSTFSPALAIAPHDDVFQSRVELAVGPQSEVYAAYFELSAEGKHLVVGRILASPQSAKSNGAIAGVAP